MQKRDSNTTTNSYSITAKTVLGLEEVLAGEIRDAGGTELEILNRGVGFQGTNETLYRCNYLCRTALRFLKPTWEFRASSDSELYNKCLALPWDSVMDLNQTFAIDGVVNHSGITHSMYAALKTKDAIADFFRNKYGRRPSVDTDDPDIRFNVHINRDHCTISLDSSGSSLHFRGYKVALGNAPLSEVLASGLIMLSGWDRKKTFIDPMCGSGTLLIEAAMMANNIPAGYYRKAFGFEKWKDFDPALWKSVKEENKPPEELSFKAIVGGDLSPLAMRSTRKNIGNAGLQKLISLHPTPFEKLKRPPGDIHILMNPPYGERIKTDDIIALYKGIGDTLKRNFRDAEAWITSGDLQAIKFVGLRPSKKIRIFNGPLECRFNKYELYEGSRKGVGGRE
ncbi:MAG: THUMP domain-containing protein [Bacteroidota bacterium]